MGFKSLTMGLALALLISAPLTTEASVYEKEASMEFNTIDVQIGKTGDFVELQNHYIVKRDLAFVCGRDYVKPCFSKKGITLRNGGSSCGLWCYAAGEWQAHCYRQ